MEEPSIHHFLFHDLDITPDQLEYQMGYTQPGSCPEPVTKMITDILERAPKLCDLKGSLLISDPAHADTVNKLLITREQLFHTGNVVTNHLRKAEKAAWFICTIGEKMPDYSRILMEQGDLMEGYVVDVAGNFIVEATMDKLHLILEKEMAKEGMNITNRYSPGYCEWDITEQKKLFSMFPGEHLDVRLTDSSLMYPIKTVSGVIGIGKEAKKNPYTCHYCNQKNCLYRDKKGNIRI